MAAVAKRTRRAMHIVGWIERGPPVTATAGDLILAPSLVYDFPLNGQRKIIVADFREVALLPNAPVNKGNLVLRELRNVVCRENRNDRARMLLRIAHYIGHRRLLPMVVNFRVAFPAGLRTDIVRGVTGLRLLSLLLVTERAKASDEEN